MKSLLVAAFTCACGCTELPSLSPTRTSSYKHDGSDESASKAWLYAKAGEASRHLKRADRLRLIAEISDRFDSDFPAIRDGSITNREQVSLEITSAAYAGIRRQMNRRGWRDDVSEMSELLPAELNAAGITTTRSWAEVIRHDYPWITVAGRVGKSAGITRETPIRYFFDNQITRMYEGDELDRLVRSQMSLIGMARREYDVYTVFFNMYAARERVDPADRNAAEIALRQFVLYLLEARETRWGGVVLSERHRANSPYSPEVISQKTLEMARRPEWPIHLFLLNSQLPQIHQRYFDTEGDWFPTQEMIDTLAAHDHPITNRWLRRSGWVP